MAADIVVGTRLQGDNTSYKPRDLTGGGQQVVMKQIVKFKPLTNKKPAWHESQNGRRICGNDKFLVYLPTPQLLRIKMGTESDGVKAIIDLRGLGVSQVFDVRTSPTDDQLIAVATDAGVLVYRVGVVSGADKTEIVEELLLHLKTADSGVKFTRVMCHPTDMMVLAIAHRTDTQWGLAIVDCRALGLASAKTALTVEVQADLNAMKGVTSIAFDNTVADFCFVGDGGHVAVCSGSTRLSIWQTAETTPREVASLARAHDGRLDAVHVLTSASGQSVLLTAGGGPASDQLRLWHAHLATGKVQQVGSFELAVPKEQQQRPTTVELDLTTRRVYLVNHKYPKMFFAVSFNVDNMAVSFDFVNEYRLGASTTVASAVDSFLALAPEKREGQKQAVLACMSSSNVRKVFLPMAPRPQPNLAASSSAKASKFAAQKPQVIELLRGALDSQLDKKSAATTPPALPASSSSKLSSSAKGSALLSLLTQKAAKPASASSAARKGAAKSSARAKSAELSTNLMDRFPALATAMSAGQQQQQKSQKQQKQSATKSTAKQSSASSNPPTPLVKLREAGRLNGAVKMHTESAERIRAMHASIDAKLAQHMDKLFARIDAENAKRQKLEEQRMKRLLSAISSTLAAQVPKQLATTVNNAVKNDILPTLQQRLSHTLDLRLKKIVPDICSQVAKQLQPLLEKGLVQRVEKQVTGQLHKNILSAFDRSFKQVVQPALAANLKAVTKAVETNSQALQKIAASINAAPAAAAAAEASAGAADTVETIKQRIQACLDAKDMTKAFHEALICNNVEVVMWLCKTVDTADVFIDEDVNTPRVLRPELLLCLLQQLSVDIESDTDIKLDWLQECMLQLDDTAGEQVVQEHGGPLVKQLCSDLDGKRASIKNSGLKRKFRSLISMGNNFIAKLQSTQA